MVPPLCLPELDENALRQLAEIVALKLRPGDVVALSGDLGAGKTTFARALIRGLIADPGAEVPSPTFSLVQTYATPRLALTHADLYRLSDPGETAELGLADAVRHGAAVVEWPERGDGIATLGARLEIRFADGAAPDRRTLTLVPSEAWQQRVARISAIRAFLATASAPFDLGAASITYLQGDASPRAYARLRVGGSGVILMDAPRQQDGPPIRDGLPYSRIAHLAEDIRPFVAVGGLLRRAGLSAPVIHAADLQRGLMLIEDLGNDVFGTALAQGQSQAELWRAATDTLIGMRRIAVDAAEPLPVAPGAAPHVLPDYDRRALSIETELVVDWYWPALYGRPISDAARSDFLAAWAPILDRLVALPRGLVLRDYHSPNLMWLPARTGLARVGILDFQDALAGPWAYDLVSLLQDARLDVPATLEAELLAHYLDTMAATEPGFDRAAFRFAYAALGAQRNTKILGIFARLARRDGKLGYLQHVPRIWGYLARSLAHPDLAPLSAWYDRHIPPAERGHDLLSR
jgi:hypothetical protein